MPAKTYDPNLVQIIFKGVPIVGFADGSFVTITPSAENFTKSVGADGEVARSKSNDNTYEVTITLMQTSLSNTYLSGVMTIDRLTNLGTGSLQIIDLSGQTLFFFDAAWVRQAPDADFAKEVGERAWVFDTAQAITEIVGGSL
jgi:hypothetical protein